MRLKN